MVSFIGAGPGDPELLTIKGKKLIDSADVIIYAGSLVNPQVLADAKEGAQIYNSATMTLEEVLAVMKDGEDKGLKVVRVHTGDPAIFGAHREQMDALDRMGITYEVIPGVSSFLATAAALKKEYTLPGVSQTVILTRMEGRTPMPEGEKLADLAKHHATMIIFPEHRYDGRAVRDPSEGIPSGHTGGCGLQGQLAGAENRAGNALEYRGEGQSCRHHQDCSDGSRRFPGR